MSTSVSGQTLKSFFFDAGVDLARANVSLRDERYALPAEDWIGGEFARHVQPVLWEQVGPYKPQESDCDKYALVAVTEAQKLHRRTQSPPEGEPSSPDDKPSDKCGLAFGFFSYVRDSGDGHAINCAVCRESQKLKLVFFEPQTQQIIRLSPTEINNCIELSI